jgi:hypothetical protein
MNNKYDEETARQLENLGNYLRQGLKWRRIRASRHDSPSGKSRIQQIVEDTVREQFPKDKEMLLKEIEKKSKSKPKPDVRPSPELEKKHQRKKR